MSKFHELKKEKKNHILSYCKYVFSSWTPCCGSFLIVLIFSFFLIFFDLTSIPNNLHTIKLVRCYEFVLEQFCSCRGLICSRINCCNFFFNFFYILRWFHSVVLPVQCSFLNVTFERIMEFSVVMEMLRSFFNFIFLLCFSIIWSLASNKIWTTKVCLHIFLTGVEWQRIFFLNKKKDNSVTFFL